MPFLFILSLISSLICFLVIPLIGAFRVQKKWRQFRNLIREMKYSRDKLILGRLDATQGQKTIWLTIEGQSIKIDASSFNMAVLQDDGEDIIGKLDPTPPLLTNWKNMGPIALGSNILIYADFQNIDGRITLTKNQFPNWIIFYEGEDASILSRLLYASRDKNEFWNILTPFSLIIGFLFIAIFAFGLFKSDENRYWAVGALNLSLLPFSALLPPGIFGFYAYRYLWKQSRRFRSRKDIVAMLNEKINLEDLSNLYGSSHPYFQLQLSLPSDPLYEIAALNKKARVYENSGIAILLLSILINSVFLFLILVQIARKI